MKKNILILSLILVLALSATYVYAKEASYNTNIKTDEWEVAFRERMDWKKEQIKDALDEGLISEEEAEYWISHFDYMEEFHRENGFMPGGCHRPRGMRGQMR